MIAAGVSAGLCAQPGTIPRDGFELHYRLEGSGKPIIFLAGGPGFNVNYFEDAAKLFPAGYQRVFLEQRGTGKSRPLQLDASNISLRLAVEDLEALRKHLGLEALIVVGHSWGGMLALAYAASHPDRLDQLILIGSGGPTREFFEWYDDNIEARLHSEDKEMRTYWDNAAKHGVDVDKAALESVKAIFPAFFFDRAKGLAFAAAIPGGSYHADTNTLMMADIDKVYDLRAGLARVTRPVLIIQGHQDPTGDKTAEEIHALVGTSMIRYINRCGHFPWVEQPEKFKEIVAAFLATGQ
jgi:proline iminopeptidase